MLSSCVCLSVCLFWPRWLDGKKGEICDSSRILLEELRPVDRNLDKVSNLRLAGEATEGRRKRRFDVLGRRLGEFGDRIGKGDVGNGVVRLLALRVERELPYTLIMTTL